MKTALLIGGGLLAGTTICIAIFVAGWNARDAQAVAEKARFEARIAAANKATETEKERLTGELRQSEERIDQAKKEYQDEVLKLNEVACVLSDSDMRSLWDGRRASRSKSPIKRRMRAAARPVAAP